MTPLTVCCVLVSGPVKGYDVEYVLRLERMVRRHLARPFRFVCFTDGTRGELPGVETIQIPSMAGIVPAYTEGIWNKVQVFSRAHGLTGRVLFLDLDLVVVDALDPIVDFPAAFALTEDAFVVERAHLNTDRYGRAVVRKFNGSVMVWDAGTADSIFDDWSPAVAERMSTDQDWIAEHAADAQAMPLAWFPRLSNLMKDEAFTPPVWPVAAKVVLVKKPKPHEAVQQWPWLEDVWNPCEVAA